MHYHSLRHRGRTRSFDMLVRSLFRVVRPHIVAASLQPRAAFLKFSSTASTLLPRQFRMFPPLSRVSSKLQASSCNCRAFSLFHGRSRPAPSAISSRSFFSSSEGPRPSLLEVVSILKLKVIAVFLFPIRSSRSETSSDAIYAACTLRHVVCWRKCGAGDCQCRSSRHEKVATRCDFHWISVVISTGFVYLSCISPFLIIATFQFHGHVVGTSSQLRIDARQLLHRFCCLSHASRPCVSAHKVDNIHFSAVSRP